MVRRNGVVVFDVMDGDSTAGSCLVTEFGGGVFLSRLFVNRGYRNRGFANWLVKEVILYAADRPVYLIPKSFRDAPMQDTHLEDWYLRMGFEWREVEGKDVMAL